MKIIGTEPEAPRRPTGRQAQQILATEMLGDWRAWAQTSTEFMARLGGQLVNDVLGVETCEIDANASPISRGWHVAAGCVQVENHDAAATLTVTTTGAGASAPATGLGVYRVRPGQSRVIAVASRVVTFYGAAGLDFSYQAFARAPLPVCS